MSIELTNLEASRMYELLAESEKLRARIAELERALGKTEGVLACVEGGIFAQCSPKTMIAEIKSVLGKGER